MKIKIEKSALEKLIEESSKPALLLESTIEKNADLLRN